MDLKSNTVLVNKKGDKQIAKNYRPVSLLPILVNKIFKKILFNSIFEYLQENTLLSDNQSGFQPSDLCELPLFMTFMHHLIVTHLKDVTGLFLDIPKAFDRVWYERLIYKTQAQCCGITVKPLKLIHSFLHNKKIK